MKRTAQEDRVVTRSEPWHRALAVNDRATERALEGRVAEAIRGFEEALSLDPDCAAARANLVFLRADEETRLYLDQEAGEAALEPGAIAPAPRGGGGRIAILSVVFNWPARGGGVMHTVELAEALGRAGYEVAHFFARHAGVGIGQVDAPLSFPSQAVDLDGENWSISGLRSGFRRAVDGFRPDHVLIADAWNTKPYLAEAVVGYPYSILVQAMETLCPLNNIRLLPGPEGTRQCYANRLATPWECRDCLGRFAATSGPLHRAERDLCQVESDDYDGLLRQSLRGAEAVFVCNPQIAAMMRPHARKVVVAPAAIDGRRFPRPRKKPGRAPGRPRDKMRVLFAGVVDEPIKGFAVLSAACALLWQHGRDFELVATGEPAGPVDEFTRFVGWLGQEELARELGEADIVVVPSIAQESFGRVAAEAMGAGIPVVASRIGGLPSTVLEGEMGLLFEPGNSHDLAVKLERLLDDPRLCRRLGRAGRARFEREFTWDVVVERCFRPVLSSSLSLTERILQGAS